MRMRIMRKIKISLASVTVSLLVLDYENEIKRAWNTMVETTVQWPLTFYHPLHYCIGFFIHECDLAH